MLTASDVTGLLATPLAAAGAFVGLPFWQTPTMINAAGFVADLAEAAPEHIETLWPAC